MWLIIILSTILAYFIYFKIIKPHNYWKDRNILYVKPWPFFGSLGPLIFRQRAVTDVAEDVYNAFPNKRYFGFFQFMLPTLAIRDLDLIKRITVKDFDVFPEHRIVLPEDADPLFSNNIFTMRGGDRWHDMRSTLSPAFTSSKLKTMFGLISQCATQFVDHFQKREGLITIEMKDAFTRYANDVIATTAFGVTCDSLENPENEFYLMGKDATNIYGLRGLKMFLFTVSPTIMNLFKCTIVPAKVDAFFRKIIKETIEVRNEKGVIRPDMIHLLLEARKGRLKHDDQTNAPDSGFAVVEESEVGKNQRKQIVEITDEDITCEAFVFFLAGFDTVSTAMCFAAYELAVNPDIQARLQEEVDSVLSVAKESPVTYEALLGMKYMDMVVTESLRKWPPVAFTDRRAVKPFTIEPEYPGEVPAHFDTGTVCWIPIYPIQRDPKYYPNPERFDPERFNDENRHSITPFSYLPFGAGPKSCLGSRFALLEIKLIVFNILRKFDIVPVEKTPIPIRLSKDGFFPAVEGGCWLGFKPRTI